MAAHTVSTAVLIWVPLASAAIGATAGLAGAWLVTRGQNRAARQARLETVYAEVMTAASTVELYLADRLRRNPKLPPDMRRELTFALARAGLLAPIDTHVALDEWAGKLARLEVLEEYRANDVSAHVERWERALLLMRRDLEAKT